MAKETKSQKEIILDYLLAGQKLTALDVWNSDYIMANTFGARIKDLKDENWNIKTEMVDTPSGKRVAQHYLNLDCKRVQVGLFPDFACA